MARPSTNQIREAIEEAVQAVVARILPAINRTIDESVKANRSVSLGKVVPFKGMVACVMKRAA